MRLTVIGTGYVGTAHAARMADLDHKVVGIDVDADRIASLSAGRAPVHEAGLSELLARTIRSGRLRFTTSLAEGAQFPRAHSVCVRTPQRAQRNAPSSHGTKNAPLLARRHGARFLPVATSEVYVDPLIHPQPEVYWGNVNPVGPRSVYDEAERYAEAPTTVHRRTYGTETGIMRIFNAYGPRMRPRGGSLVSTFVRQALARAAPTIYGDGGQTHSFCYVDDLVQGLIAMLDSHHEGPVNLGNTAEYSARELAEPVLAAIGSSSPLDRRPLPTDDPTRRCADITRARELLNWAPEVTLTEGLRRTVDRSARTLTQGRLRQPLEI
jgi:nucleoside-diphosphate-sugar epimerase